MLDIVTVVFQQEIEILRVQAQSIDIYGDPDTVDNIYVVVNDRKDVTKLIDPQWWGQYADRVHVIHCSMFNADLSENGWLSQQVLKLLASSISYNQWTMVLDAKTILIRPVTCELWDEQNRIRSGSFAIYPVFYPSKDIVNQFFNIDLDYQIGPGGVPFFFRPSVLRQMIAAVEAQVTDTFPTWFQAQGRLTEFILYSGYTDLIGDQSYNLTDNAIRPVNICHSETGIFDVKIDQVKQTDPLTVSIHRHAWSNITEQQKQVFKDLLINRQLTSAKDLK